MLKDILKNICNNILVTIKVYDTPYGKFYSYPLTKEHINDIFEKIFDKHFSKLIIVYCNIEYDITYHVKVFIMQLIKIYKKMEQYSDNNNNNLQSQ